MRCLTDIEVQAVADGEAGEEMRAHAAGCAACAARVEDVRRTLTDVSAVMDAGARMPAQLESRVRDAVMSASAVRGSTTLRTAGTAPLWRRPRVLLPLATAAVIVLMVFGLLPRFGGSPTTLSASQVLGRSLETIQQLQGVEILEYELVTSGMTQGTWHIWMVTDHDRPERFHVRVMEPGGEVVSAISQDPLTGQRSQLVRVDGRNYIVNVVGVTNPVLSLPQMAQAGVETIITMMQATSDQQLTTLNGPNGRQYVVQTPVTTARSPATLDLEYGRAVVDADDFRIAEFEARGTLLRQPFSVSFRLVGHMQVGPVAILSERRDGSTVNVNLFGPIEPAPGDVVLDGAPTHSALDELLFTVIRELGRSRPF